MELDFRIPSLGGELTAVRWRREMKLPKRPNAGGRYSTGKKKEQTEEQPWRKSRLGRLE